MYSHAAPRNYIKQHYKTKKIKRLTKNLKLFMILQNHLQVVRNRRRKDVLAEEKNPSHQI